jgi:hypothetical protein
MRQLLSLAEYGDRVEYRSPRVAPVFSGRVSRGDRCGRTPPDPSIRRPEEGRLLGTNGRCHCILVQPHSAAVNLSGESPDDGRFPVRPSSLTPNVARRRTTSKAGATRYLSRQGAEHVTASGRSQSGGLGKRVGRSITRTMQRRKVTPVGYCWQRRVLVGDDSLIIRGSLVLRRQYTTGGRRGPAGVGLTAHGESTAAKVGKVSRVASALPHSEGVAYKRQGREVAACPRDWRMGS